MNDIAQIFSVRGRVQGVGFRHFVLSIAPEYGVRGYVRNMRDGSVEVLAIGSEKILKLFAQAVEKGPRFGRVTAMDIGPASVDMDQYKIFRVKY